MGCFQVQSCCCCVDLQSGTKFIGFMHTFCALVLTIYIICIAVSWRETMGTIDDVDGTYTKAFPFACGIASTGSVHVALGIVLLVGAIKRNTKMLHIWTIIMTILYLVAIFFFGTLTVMNGPTYTGWELFLRFIEGCAFLGLVGYCIVCVRGYYLSLKSEEDMRGPEDQCYDQQDYNQQNYNQQIYNQQNYNQQNYNQQYYNQQSYNQQNYNQQY